MTWKDNMCRGWIRIKNGGHPSRVEPSVKNYMKLFCVPTRPTPTGRSAYSSRSTLTLRSRTTCDINHAFCCFYMIHLYSISILWRLYLPGFQDVQTGMIRLPHLQVAIIDLMHSILCFAGRMFRIGFPILIYINISLENVSLFLHLRPPKTASETVPASHLPSFPLYLPRTIGVETAVSLQW